jgi:hypothetical protein
VIPTHPAGHERRHPQTGHGQSLVGALAAGDGAQIFAEQGFTGPGDPAGAHHQVPVDAAHHQDGPFHDRRRLHLGILHTMV